MTTPNDTALQPVQPAAPAAVQPAAPAVIPDAREVMQSIIDKHNANNIPIEAREQVSLTPVAPVSPVGPETAAPQYQQPAPYETENYRAIEAVIVDALAGPDRQSVYDLGAACLNQMPDLITHNANYVLQVLGLDPQTAQVKVDARNAREYAASATLASETDRLFDEYVAKGVAAGLSQLEAAGLAAIAYQEFSRGYWKDGSEWRRSFDAWHREVMGGYRLGPKRDAFHKMFDAAFRRVAEKHNYHRLNSQTGASGARYAGLRGEELMAAMLRDRSAE